MPGEKKFMNKSLSDMLVSLILFKMELGTYTIAS